MIPDAARTNVKQAKAYAAAALHGPGTDPHGFDYPDIRSALRQATDWLAYADGLLIAEISAETKRRMKAEATQ
jgi:hypothetical protein